MTSELRAAAEKLLEHGMGAIDRSSWVAKAVMGLAKAYLAGYATPEQDWRIGIAVTPKMRTHYWFRQLGVIRVVWGVNAGSSERIDVELYHGEGETTLLHEPSSEWMTA